MDIKTKPTLFLASFLLAALFRLLAMSASAAVRYVDVNSASPAPPYTTWATAASVIQDAIDVAEAGDEIVVTNGVYQAGGRAVYSSMTNRVAVDKPLTLRSLNGPEVTVIDGAGAVRCVYLTNGAVLVGFTLTNGAAQSGGGVWCESTSSALSNCWLSGNLGSYSGGGAYGGALNNCTFSGNSAFDAGGAFGGTLNNCKLSSNSAHQGGGGLRQHAEQLHAHWQLCICRPNK